MTTPLSDISRTLEQIAREAGADLKQRFGGPRTVEKKGAIDLVTDADRAAEELILRRLEAAFPGTFILSEESGAVGSATRQGLTFVVDPLDGTTNYAHGLPHFCTTIAARDEHGLAAGVIYDPLRDEMYSGIRGEGAFCNGTRLRVTSTSTLDDAVLATGFPYDLRSRADEILAYFLELIQRSRAVRRFGSAALDLAYVAQGRYDGYWERGLKPWDMAAGVLLVQEARGTVTDYAGNPVTLERGECLAAGPALWRELLAVTAPIRAQEPAG